MAEATVSEAPGGVTDLEAAATAGSRLGVAIGADCWLIELSQAGEVLPVPEAIAVVPGARSWFKGLANLRGTLHGVIDLPEFRYACSLFRAVPHPDFFCFLRILSQ